eukprot:1133510-Pelagomonas_calceolata.AAC.1
MAEVSNLPCLLESVYLLTETGELSYQMDMRLWALEADAQAIMGTFSARLQSIGAALGKAFQPYTNTPLDPTTTSAPSSSVAPASSTAPAPGAASASSAALAPSAAPAPGAALTPGVAPAHGAAPVLPSPFKPPFSMSRHLLLSGQQAKLTAQEWLGMGAGKGSTTLFAKKMLLSTEQLASADGDDLKSDLLSLLATVGIEASAWDNRLVA